MNIHALELSFLVSTLFLKNCLIPNYRNFHVAPVVPSVYSGFLSQSKDMHFKLIGDS